MYACTCKHSKPQGPEEHFKVLIFENWPYLELARIKASFKSSGLLRRGGRWDQLIWGFDHNSTIYDLNKPFNFKQNLDFFPQARYSTTTTFFFFRNDSWWNCSQILISLSLFLSLSLHMYVYIYIYMYICMNRRAGLLRHSRMWSCRHGGRRHLYTSSSFLLFSL